MGRGGMSMAVRDSVEQIVWDLELTVRALVFVPSEVGRCQRARHGQT